MASKSQQQKLAKRRARKDTYLSAAARYAPTQQKLTERAAGVRARWDSERPDYEDPQLVHDAEQAKVADIISQGLKSPRTWDENNSFNPAGGTDR